MAEDADLPGPVCASGAGILGAFLRNFHEKCKEMDSGSDYGIFTIRGGGAV